MCGLRTSERWVAASAISSSGAETGPGCLPEPAHIDLDERLHRRVDAGDVARGQEVEQQSARHGHAQTRVCASQRTRDSEADIDLGDRVKPVLHDAVEHLDGVRTALKRLSVELEEQPLVGPQLRVGDVLPPRPYRLIDRLTGV